MALRAGYYGLKRALIEKVKVLPGFSAIGTGLQINSDGELESTGATTTIDPNPEGDPTTSLEKLQIGDTIYGVNDNTKCYQIDDDTETAIVDDDYIPFYDASASAPKKSTWSNFISKIQSKLTVFVDWISYSVLGAKNRLDNTAVSGSLNNVTWVVNSNGTVTVTTGEGGASGAVNITLVPWTYHLFPEEPVIISDDVGDPNGYVFIMRKKGASGATDYGGGSTNNAGHQFIYTADYSEYDYFRIDIYIPNGKSLDNVTFKPMWRSGNIPDSSYVPYAMTNRELTEKNLNKGLLTSADDLDDIKTTGWYTASTSPAHSPESQTYYSLFVDEYGNAVRQLVFRGDAIYTRRYGGSPAAWTNWVKYTGTTLT